MTVPAAGLRIDSATSFSSILRQLKQCLVEGSLRQVHSGAPGYERVDVATLGEEGAWPDYVEAHFEESRGRRFRLSVETYHGAGGSWDAA